MTYLYGPVWVVAVGGDVHVVRAWFADMGVYSDCGAAEGRNIKRVDLVVDRVKAFKDAIRGTGQTITMKILHWS